MIKPIKPLTIDNIISNSRYSSTSIESGSTNNNFNI